jgi:hypothetical protein
MVGLHLAVLIIFSEAALENSVDTAFYIFTVVSLPSGASVRKDVWVQVPPSALKKLDFSGFFLLSTCQQPMSHMTRVTLGILVRVPRKVPKTA